MGAEQFNTALAAVEDKYDSDIFVYSAPIDNDGFSALTEAVTQKKNSSTRPHCLMILTTTGGLANSAYQIARLLQQTYGSFTIFTPRYCKSAGTIIALGAHCILMDVFSELGPLDVQLLDRDEIGNRKSGLLTRSAFESLSNEVFDLFSKNMLGIKKASRGMISFKLAADISWRMTAELMAPIFGQLNPDIIGSDYRDLRIAKLYGDRLANVSGNPKPDTVRQLVEDYPAHDFIIDKDEASKLFRRIEEPTAELYAFVSLISHVSYQQASPGIVMACEPFKIDADAEGNDDENPIQDPDERAAEMAEGGQGDRGGDQRDALPDEENNDQAGDHAQNAGEG
ncbi:SDH family Clp fold serine proteinase [Aminobacter niigataensis]|uniref:SDH family Clp fold serine proteinase n=1 Tax=Aminobacter niigataensis TaxID=83265 RepID=UPI0024CDDDB3|nr:hypothetical protein [Aminobacter niigataensis]CAI2936233.1 Serine dehydrogenase proteinase [Aminobacter niigataensis]